MKTHSVLFLIIYIYYVHNLKLWLICAQVFRKLLFGFNAVRNVGPAFWFIVVTVEVGATDNAKVTSLCIGSNRITHGRTVTRVAVDFIAVEIFWILRYHSASVWVCLIEQKSVFFAVIIQFLKG